MKIVIALVLMTWSCLVTAIEVDYFLESNDIEAVALRGEVVSIKLKPESRDDFARFSSKNLGNTCSLYFDSESKPIARFVFHAQIDSGVIRFQKPSDGVLTVLQELSTPSNTN